MSKQKQLLVSIALASVFMMPFSVSAQNTVPVSANTAIRVSGQSDKLYKDTCQLVKEVNSDADDVHTLDLSPEQKSLTLVRFTKNFSLSSAITYYACPAETIAKIQTTSGISSLSSLPEILLNVFGWIISVINDVLTWVLYWAGYLLVQMIGQGKFITSEIVTQAWPFVQGLANLGFIFALLYIALATTLRLESVSSSIQKLLPRLLVAALLVNFSLVIGGLLIDASRLVMAAEIKIMGNGSLDFENFTAELIKSSNNTAATLAAMNNVDSSNASAVALKMIQSVVFLGLLTAAIFTVAFNLFIRYIALLILLILSPMAYLSFALPKTSKYASQWWEMFIKWVLYGPIVLFFLIIITRIQNVDIVLSETASGNKLFTVFFNQFIHFAIIIALFFVANSVGKKVAGAGSDAVMGFAKKNPRAAFIAGASVLTGGLGGGIAAAALTSRSARDGYSGAGKNIKAGLKELPGIKQASRILTPGKRDKNGNLLPGQGSLGATLSSKLTDRFNPKIQKDIQDVKKLMPGGVPIIPTVLNDKALSPSQLKKGHVVSALGENEKDRDANIKVIIESGSQSQRMALAKNKDYVASLSSTQLSELQKTIQDAAGVDAKDKSAMIEQVMKTVDEIDK